MDQIKIGKFIAERRKFVNLTQFELAEKLDITDRAVSRWETGKTMPDSSIMLELCSILKISVNELLSGEILSMDDYKNQLEKNLIEAVKQKEQADKRLLTLEVVIIVLSVLVLLIPILLAAYLELETWQRIVLVCSGVIPCVVGLFFAIKIEQVAGYYECQKCGHKYVPTFKQASFSMHMGRTKYLKCPKCGERSWQKKVISKD